MTEQQKEQRITALSWSRGVCEVCGKPLGSQAQYAHKIANTQANRTKYGAFFIDHPKNGCYVCSLKCNDACNIGNNPREVLKLLADIIIYEMRNF